MYSCCPISSSIIGFVRYYYLEFPAAMGPYKLLLVSASEVLAVLVVLVPE
jgi:hypothetical protein